MPNPQTPAEIAWQEWDGTDMPFDASVDTREIVKEAFLAGYSSAAGAGELRIEELTKERDNLQAAIDMMRTPAGSIHGRILDSMKGFSSGIDTWTCQHCGRVNNSKSINCTRCRK